RRTYHPRAAAGPGSARPEVERGTADGVCTHTLQSDGGYDGRAQRLQIAANLPCMRFAVRSRCLAERIAPCTHHSGSHRNTGDRMARWRAAESTLPAKVTVHCQTPHCRSVLFFYVWRVRPLRSSNSRMAARPQPRSSTTAEAHQRLGLVG